MTATRIERDIVTVSGSDAGDYLQTQLTQDVLSLDVGDSAWSFLLKSKSQIIALMRVTRAADAEYSLEMEAGWGDVVRQTIDEFLGRTDISFAQETMHIDGEDEQSRIARGWPRMGREIDDSTTPAMTGIVAETIAFEKGCYTGQEFVARVHYRDAAPPKRLVRVVFDDAVAIAEGDVIVISDEEVGTVTSAARGVAIGYLKRSVDTPSRGTVGDADVEVLPLRPS